MKLQSLIFLFVASVLAQYRGHVRSSSARPVSSFSLAGPQTLRSSYFSSAGLRSPAALPVASSYLSSGRPISTRLPQTRRPQTILPQRNLAPQYNFAPRNFAPQFLAPQFLAPQYAGRPLTSAFVPKSQVLVQAAQELQWKAGDLHSQAGKLLQQDIMTGVAEELEKEAEILEVKADELVEEAVNDESDNGLACCDDVESAHCAACKLEMKLFDFCALPGIRELAGCGFGAPKGQCGLGVVSADGLTCCDAEECGGKCGGLGCRLQAGGPSRCCASKIIMTGIGCDSNTPPCVNGPGHEEGLRNYIDGKQLKPSVNKKKGFWTGYQRGGENVSPDINAAYAKSYEDGTLVKSTRRQNN